MVYQLVEKHTVGTDCFNKVFDSFVKVYLLVLHTKFKHLGRQDIKVQSSPTLGYANETEGQTAVLLAQCYRMKPKIMRLVLLLFVCTIVHMSHTIY